MNCAEEAFGQIMPVGIRSGDERGPEPTEWAADMIDAMHKVHAALANAQTKAQTARNDALREAAERSSRTVRSIKEALDKRDWDDARKIAMKGPPAILALTQPTEPRTDAAKEE
jgi:hypothetical protein